MEDKITFRPLKANEIECRVGNVAKDESGFFLLLYKNARVDQTILDETFGIWNWQCKYYQVKNTMVCSIGIYNKERKEWIWKDNGGDDDSQMEQVKAELSDSFKRAAFCLGIGRELYYSPKIYIKATDENSKKARYTVQRIEYDENKRITDLTIINDKTKEVVFLYSQNKKVAAIGAKVNNEETTNAKEEQRGSIDKEDLVAIQQFVAAFTRKESLDNFYKWLDKTYGTMNIESLTYSQGKQVLTRLMGKRVGA